MRLCSETSGVLEGTWPSPSDPPAAAWSPSPVRTGTSGEHGPTCHLLLPPPPPDDWERSCSACVWATGHPRLSSSFSLLRDLGDPQFVERVPSGRTAGRVPFSAAGPTASANTCPGFCVYLSSCLWEKRRRWACWARWYFCAHFYQKLATVSQSGCVTLQSSARVIQCSRFYVVSARHGHCFLIWPSRQVRR